LEYTTQHHTTSYIVAKETKYNNNKVTTTTTTYSTTTNSTTTNKNNINIYVYIIMVLFSSLITYEWIIFLWKSIYNSLPSTALIHYFNIFQLSNISHLLSHQYLSIFNLYLCCCLFVFDYVDIIKIIIFVLVLTQHPWVNNLKQQQQQLER
jgi:hypothetical protein